MVSQKEQGGVKLILKLCDDGNLYIIDPKRFLILEDIAHIEHKIHNGIRTIVITDKTEYYFKEDMKKCR